MDNNDQERYVIVVVSFLFVWYISYIIRALKTLVSMMPNHQIINVTHILYYYYYFDSERGITILAKNLAVMRDGYKINIMDTPGYVYVCFSLILFYILLSFIVLSS